METRWTDETHRYLPGGDLAAAVPVCAHCGGVVSIRDPRGDCDHLFWPEKLTDEAKIANGYTPLIVTKTLWVKTGEAA